MVKSFTSGIFAFLTATAEQLNQQNASKSQKKKQAKTESTRTKCVKHFVTMLN